MELVNAQRAGRGQGSEVVAARSTSTSVALWGEQTLSEVSGLSEPSDRKTENLNKYIQDKLKKKNKNITNYFKGFPGRHANTDSHYCRTHVAVLPFSALAWSTMMFL